MDCLEGIDALDSDVLAHHHGQAGEVFGVEDSLHGYFEGFDDTEPELSTAGVDICAVIREEQLNHLVDIPQLPQGSDFLLDFTGVFFLWNVDFDKITLARLKSPQTLAAMYSLDSSDAS
jgi:hypothetical protein